jgi:putative SbcD/Mre11-related phosphoesterase
MRFVTGEPALVVGDALVVADLHIGIEAEFRRAGVHVPSQTKAMVERLDRLIERTGAKRLVIIGDVKHRVPGTSFQELKELPGFFLHLSRKVKVEVVPGNHDTNLKALAPKAVIHPSAGVMAGDAWLCHGHAWPPAGFLKARYIIIGHSHPQFEFRNSLGYRWLEPVWVKAPFRRQALARRFKTASKGRLPELIVMPSFNPFAGGAAVNRERKQEELLGPVIKAADMGKAEVSLLDGTLLGKVKNLVLK